MVPIENAAGGAAFVFHNKSERAPYKHTDKIANVKQHRNEKHCRFIDYTEQAERADRRNEKHPNNHNAVGGFRCGNDMVAKCLRAYFIAYRSETVGKQL